VPNMMLVFRGLPWR